MPPRHVSSFPNPSPADSKSHFVVKARECTAHAKVKIKAAERPFRRLQTTPQPGVAYLNSNLADADAPSLTSISCSIGLPLFSAGCQATNLYLPAGTSLISNFPSTPTTA